MKQMNKMIKIFALAAYSLLIFSAAVLIINATKKVDRFSEYTNQAYNEDILVGVQMMEVRQCPEETSTDYEYSKFDTYVYVSKNPKAGKTVITNMYSYVCVESEDHKYGYVESSSSKSMSESTYTIGTMSMLNSSTAYSYNKVTVADDVVTHENRSPKYVYVKVAYDIKYVGQDGEAKHKELNYRFEYKDMDVTKLDEYEQRTIGSSYINGNDIIKIKLVKTENSNGTVENIKLYNVSVNSQLLNDDPNTPGAKETITSSSIKIFGVSSSHESFNLNTKNPYFPSYIKLFTLEGTLNTSYSMSSVRTVSVNKYYEMDKIYVNASVTTSTGRTLTCQYYVNVSDLLDR